ncbi:MAG: polysaccharide deacetylase family protein [Pseudomonadota bacterium]
MFTAEHEVKILKRTQRFIGCAIISLFSTASCAPQSEVHQSVASECGDDALGVHRVQSLIPGQALRLEQLNEYEVVLTFDDGPDGRNTRNVLDLLANSCTQATFFLRGDSSARDPELVRQIVRQGHTVGGHSWAHADLSNLELADAKSDIERGMEAINGALSSLDGAPQTRFFRFPFIRMTPDLLAYLAEEGLIEVGVSADGADWENRPPEDIVAQIMDRIEASENRGIILLHDTSNRSIRATDQLLIALKQGGYKIVALSADQS